MKHFIRSAALAAAVGLAGPLIAALGGAGQAEAKTTVSVAYLADPSHEAVMWAIRNGRVTSELVEIDATPLDISALIQATAARTYEIVQTAAMAIPRARARGLDLRIVGTGLRYHASGEGAGIWVRADSDITEVGQLAGRQLGVYSIGSAGITLIRIALQDVHGLDTAVGGGDVTLVEMPAPALPAALASGRIDAATLIHAQAFQAMQTGEFRAITQTAEDLTEKFGTRMVSAVLAGYGERLDAAPEVHLEALRMLRASMDYARANPDEVFPAVAAETGVDPAFFAAWFERFSEFPVQLTGDDARAIGLLWARAQQMELLDDVPEVASTLWTPALED